MQDYEKASVLRSRVNGFLSLLFVGSLSLAAWLAVWNAAFGENPLANLIAEQAMFTVLSK